MNWNNFLNNFKKLPKEQQEQVTNEYGDKVVKKAKLSSTDTKKSLKLFSIFFDAQIKAASLDTSGRTLDRVRTHLLSKIPLAVHDYLTGELKLEGCEDKATREQILDFYLNTKEFRNVWEKLSLNQKDMEDIIDREIKEIDS